MTNCVNLYPLGGLLGIRVVFALCTNVASCHMTSLAFYMTSVETQYSDCPHKYNNKELIFSEKVTGQNLSSTEIQDMI